eukprot:9686427-Alexandrium_andersonii.AAC.1
MTCVGGYGLVSSALHVIAMLSALRYSPNGRVVAHIGVNPAFGQSSTNSASSLLALMVTCMASVPHTPLFGGLLFGSHSTSRASIPPFLPDSIRHALVSIHICRARVVTPCSLRDTLHLSAMSLST